MSETCPTVRIKTARGFALLDAHAFDPAKHELYDAPSEQPAPPAPAVPPLPPVAIDPLDAIRVDPDWRNAKGAGVAKIKKIAEAVSGRTPENGDEAIAIIEAELDKAEPAPAPVPPPPPA